MADVPSSKNRRRVEIPVGHYDRLKQISDAEGRTITSVLDELLGSALRGYEPVWAPSGEPNRLSDALTGVARRSLDEARTSVPAQFHHNYCGTEHVLLALAQDRDGVAGRVLRAAGLGSEQVASSIEFIVGRGNAPARNQPRYTPRVFRVLALTLDEARQLEHSVVSTGHLLLGLIREGEGLAAGIWESHGVDPKKLRSETLQTLVGEAWITQESVDDGERVAAAETMPRIHRQAGNSVGPAGTPFTDLSLNCASCGKEFVFTAGEQEFYAGKGFSGRPGRCPDCRGSLSMSSPGDPATV